MKDQKELFEKYSQCFTGNGDYCFDYVNEAHFIEAAKEVHNKAVQECIDELARIWLYPNDLDLMIKCLEKLKLESPKE